MDGVLVDAREWHYIALNKALNKFGFTIDRASHLQTYDGLPTHAKLTILSEVQNLPQSLHPMINSLKQSYTMSIAYNSCKPLFHIQYCLSQLKAHGYLISVCSNSIKPTVNTFLQLSGLLPFIDSILSNEDVSMPKPDPEIYISAMNNFGLTPSQCLIVEDNPNGIQAAKASKANVLVVSDPSQVTIDNLLSKINSL